jgi:hypothetical protein
VRGRLSLLKDAIDGRPGIEFWFVCVLALLLYIPLLSVQYDTNGIIEAMGVEQGPLINKNHMLYRPLGLLMWKALQSAGYMGNSLPVLQVLSAFAAAVGLGFAHLAFKRATGDRLSAHIGAMFLATSFSYWICATDAFYVTVAAMFGAAALACVVYSRSGWWLFAAAVLSALSVFTWQASIFLFPALLLVMPRSQSSIRSIAMFACTFVVLLAVVFGAVALASQGWMNPQEFWTWFTHYSENATLDIWGKWELQRVPTAGVNALDSILAIRLAATPSEWLQPVQLGRIAVDFSVLAFTMLLALIAIKPNRDAFRFLGAYFCFWPFIVWWDPGSHKWFLIPNIFLTAFLATSLVPWLRHTKMRWSVFVAVLVIAGTNFFTTVRPLHFYIGNDRSMAECVAQKMQRADVFMAAEWGWPDYLQYLHQRSTVNLINQSAVLKDPASNVAAARELIDTAHKSGANVYMVNPRHLSAAHFQWLQESTGLTKDHLMSLGGSSSFVCYGRTIDRL